MAPTIPERPSAPPEALPVSRQSRSPGTAIDHGGPGLLRMSRRRRAITDRAVAAGLRRERRAIGPAQVRRRERSAKRAALISYRKFSHRHYSALAHVVLRLTRDSSASHDGQHDQLASTHARPRCLSRTTGHMSTLRGRASAAPTANDGRPRSFAPTPPTAPQRAAAPDRR